MKTVPRNYKAIPLIKKICNKIFKANVLNFELYCNINDHAVLCHLKSKERLAIWYDQTVQTRLVLAITDVNSYKQCVIRSKYNTMDELIKVMNYFI
jgi:hypothetical protein